MPLLYETPDSNTIYTNKQILLEREIVTLSFIGITWDTVSNKRCKKIDSNYLIRLPEDFWNVSQAVVEETTQKEGNKVLTS